MKRAASQKRRRIFLGVILAFTYLLTVFITPAHAAVLFTSDISGCSGYGHGALRVEDQSLTIPSATAISSIVLRVSQLSGEASSRIRIYDDNANNPGSLLGTFNYASTNGNYVTYAGSTTLISSGKYWLRFSTTASFFPCYNVNPLFTGSLSGWSVGKVRESVDSGATFTERADNLSFLFVINGSGGGSGPIISTLSISGNSFATFRQSITSTATLGVDGSQGRVTFYSNGKRIAGCINRATSGLSATCIWMPSTRGSISLTARLIPTDSQFAATTSPAASIRVVTRTNKR